MNINELNSFKMSDAVQMHDMLNPSLFNDDHLKDDVREKLLEIAEEFIDDLGINGLNVTDIVMSGSNAAYSYTPHSDIDLHIITDMKKLPNDSIYQELFTAKKNLFNANHSIRIKNYDVEVYVQDSNKPVRTLGEYSILNDKWNKLPSKRRANFDQSAVEHKFDKLVHLSELALRSDDMTTLGDLLGTIKRYRQAGLDEHGEFGPENLAFKALRTHGIVDKLYDHMNELKSRQLSLDEMIAEQREPLVWLKGKLSGSYTDKQLKELGAKLYNGQWAMPKTRFDTLVRLGQLRESNSQAVNHSKNTYLWHGSRHRNEILIPRQAKDTGGIAGSNQNAIYATTDPKVAIAMGLTTSGSDTGMFPNDPQMVLFSGKIRKGEDVYLHKLPMNGPDGQPQFVQGGNSREFHSIPGVKSIKPTEIKAVPVDKYLNLIRQATPQDLELQKKYMNHNVMEGINPDVYSNTPWTKSKKVNGITLTATHSIKPKQRFQPGEELVITASIDGREIGRVYMSTYSPGRIPDNLPNMDLSGNALYVDPEYRRKGIATMMYDFVQELGNTIVNMDDDTPDGQKFWKARKKQQDVTEDSSSIRLKDLARVSTNMPDADFWIIRKGSDKTVGTPVKEFNPERIGIKIVRTDVLDPQYLYYTMMHLHNQGYFAKVAVGTLKLVNIKVADVANISFGRRDVDEDYDPNGRPPGPEFPPTMPRGTVKVDVSDVYDWYKLGQHISNLKGLGKHDFGKGPPSTIISFGDEDTEHKYIKDLEKTGLSTTDIDPSDPKQPKNMKRQKVDPTYNVAESKITLSTDPNWYGATIDNYKATGPVVNIPVNQLVGFEPDDKMNQPKSKANVEKIVMGLKRGDKLPPLLVRKYKNGYQVLDGHHRFWAYKSVGTKTIPVQIVPKSDIEEKGQRDVTEASPFPKSNDYIADELDKLQQYCEQNNMMNTAEYAKAYSMSFRESMKLGVQMFFWMRNENYYMYKSINKNLKIVGDKIDLTRFIKRELARKNSRIIESFNNPYKLKLQRADLGGTRDYETTVQLSDGSDLNIIFNDSDKGQYYVEFYRNGSGNVTGEGDAQRIFATVLNAIQKFIKKYKPNRLSWMANKELGKIEDRYEADGRVKLYNRMVQRYATAWGYESESEDHGDHVVYELTRMNNLKEASGYIPSEAEKNDPRFKTALTVDIHPNTMKQNAKKLGSKISRAGIPPILKPSGKI